MRLPAKSAADVHLADAFEAAGCPICAEVARTDAQWLESILAESVNDIPFRQGLDRARGVCRRHAREVLEADRRRAGSLGAAILLRATLATRLRDIEAVHATKGWTRSRRADEAARPPRCPGCAREQTTLDWVAGALVRLAEDRAWADAIGGAAFCLDHLVLLLRERTTSPGWAAAEARQLERLRDLRDLLDGFAHTSSHDRRHLQTDEQRAAVDAAADLLAGDTASPLDTPRRKR
jgi:bacterioferritin-associated ferredoxin